MQRICYSSAKAAARPCRPPARAAPPRIFSLSRDIRAIHSRVYRMPWQERLLGEAVYGATCNIKVNDSLCFRLGQAARPLCTLRPSTSAIFSQSFRQGRQRQHSISATVRISSDEMPAPTLVIVPGLWMGPRPYELFVGELKKKAPSLADVIVAPIKSTGTSSPGNPNMQDDARGIREVIKPLVEAGKRVVLVCHSAGAFLGGMATEDLEVGEKLAASGGGVERFIFITGGLLPRGTPHPKMSAPLDVQDGRAYPLNREDTLFHDVDRELTAKYIAIFECQPAEGWGVGECSYTGWEKVPTNYIICENDRVMGKEFQEKCAQMAKSEIIRIPTGHMPQLANPQLLAEKVISCLDLSN